MSNKDIVQSSGSAIDYRTDSPGCLASSTVAKENSGKVAMHDRTSALRVQKRQDLSQHTSLLLTPSTIANEEVQPCLGAVSSGTGSFDEKVSTGTETAFTIARNLGSATLSFATGPLPI